METDPGRIKELAERKLEKNLEFRAFLKNYNIRRGDLDSIVHRLYREVSQQIACTDCANCCREVAPGMGGEDIARLSKVLGISASEFQEKYLAEGQYGGLIIKQKPCPFLKGNRCAYYKFRPEDCRSYPHLHIKDISFRLFKVVSNCYICPIVYNVYERLKEELGWSASD